MTDKTDTAPEVRGGFPEMKPLDHAPPGWAPSSRRCTACTT